MSAATHGAEALQALLGRLADVSNETCCDPDGNADMRDYREMSEIVLASIEANMHHVDRAHREGYLRALTDLLGMVADGCTPAEDWNPIVNTEAAFMAPLAAAEAIRRASHA